MPFTSTAVIADYYGKESIYYDSTGNISKLRGGSGYVSAFEVSTYNLTANSLRLRYDIQNGIIN